jgi:D-xylose transport system ATP-binding protein
MSQSPKKIPVLEVVGARKAFGSVQALVDASLTVGEGEIVALLGDNGAGKSTLIKAIAGLFQLDGGEIRIGGRAVRIRSAQDAMALGIETVYQDLGIFDNLTAIENFFAGRELARPAWFGPLAFLRRRRMRSEWEAHASRLGLAIKRPEQEVGLMSGGQRQMIAVARAVAFAQRLVILDEPTAALSVRARAEVLDLVRRLPSQGASVILISHNLDEVQQVCDRAVVLRLGRNAGEAAPTPDNHERIVSMIIGAQRETRDG